MDTKMNLKLFLVASTLGFLLNSSSALAQEEVVYFHTDAIGSVPAVTDNSGALIARWDYLPFGELWPAVPPYPAEVRQFAGKERDSATGLDYFGARYLRPVAGRLTSVDPGGGEDRRHAGSISAAPNRRRSAITIGQFRAATFEWGVRVGILLRGAVGIDGCSAAGKTPSNESSAQE